MQTLIDDKTVLDTLLVHKSMALLELSSLLGLDETRLAAVVDDLEQRRLVKVINKGDILNEIVTVTGKAFQAVS
jgi:DNA-binding MarR family transcriptional regulator